MAKKYFEGGTDWMDDAACAGRGEDFYPPEEKETHSERVQRQDRAKAICGQCAVRAECLEFALQHYEKDGIWGGLTERERYRIRRAQRLEESA